MATSRWGNCWLVTALCLAVTGNESRAVEVTFELDDIQSALASDMFVVPVAASATSQDPPTDSSLTTTYSGTITVDVDDLSNPTSIRFVSASATAANSGDWLPDANGGSEGDPGVDGDADPGIAEPANYGWHLDLGAVGSVYAASRGTVLNVRSTARGVTAGDFDPTGIFVTSPQGTFDANVSSGIFGDGADSDPVDEEKGINCTDVTGVPDNCPGLLGNYSVAGDVATLSLPLHFVLGGAHGVTDFNGDGEIDAADFTVWRDNLGSTDPLIDADGSGIVDQGDYDLWVLEFGEEVDDDDDFLATFTGQFVGTATLTNSSVPEPSSAALVIIAIVSLGVMVRRQEVSVEHVGPSLRDGHRVSERLRYTKQERP